MTFPVKIQAKWGSTPHLVTNDKMNVTKGHIRVLLLLVAVLLVGCTEPELPRSEAQEEICLDAAVWHMMSGAPLRAMTYDNQAALQAGTFKCYAYNDGTTTQYIAGSTVSYNGSQWLFNDGKHYWPAEGALNFLAYMPHDLANTYCTIDPTAYDVSENPDGYSEDCARVVCANLPVAITKGSDATRELVLAYTGGQTKSTNSGMVDLTFMHPFARVCFKLSNASGTNVTVNSITIPDIKNNGSFTFDGTTTTWTLTGDNADFVLSGNPATDNDAVYLVIPGNYGSKTLTVNATWEEWSDVTKNVTADVTFNWAVGYSYTYTLTLSKYALTVDTDKYTEQW